MQKGIRYGTFLFTCTGASIGQVGRDCEFSALIHTHALQTFVNASDQSALPEQAHLCVSFLVAETKQKFDEDTKRNVRSLSTHKRMQTVEKGRHLQDMRADIY